MINSLFHGLCFLLKISVSPSFCIFTGSPLLPDFFLDEFDEAAVEQAQKLGAKPKFFDGKVVESEKPKAGGQVSEVKLI